MQARLAGKLRLDAKKSTNPVVVGDYVSQKQPIAEMGNTDSETVKLHFEIRKLGKPIDPSQYLPKK